jgi:hypothetical protein
MLGMLNRKFEMVEWIYQAVRASGNELAISEQGCTNSDSMAELREVLHLGYNIRYCTLIGRAHHET